MLNQLIDVEKGMVATPDEAGDQSIIYLAVENLPSELPKDASKMFANSLTDYLKQINSGVKSHGAITEATIPEDLKTGMIIC